MKIALLTNFIAPYRLPLLEELHDRVGELRIFLSTPMESDRQWEVDWGKLNVTVQRSISWTNRYHDGLGFSRRLQIHFPYDTLPQLIRFKPDVVISGELGMRSAQAALYRTIHHDTALLIWATLSEHSERNWGHGRKALRRSILSRADGVLVNGESGARYIKSFDVPENRITRVNQPIEVDLFSRSSEPRSPSSPLRLLYVGALSPRKGLIGFMAALTSWAAANQDKTFEILWLGDGEDRPALEALHLPEHITQRFYGNQPYQALPKFYAEGDVLVFPSLMDEWGLVVNEAMASGLPVMGSIYSQAVEELVEDSVTGWTFDPTVPMSVTAALDRVFATSFCALQAMGKVARQRISKLTPASASDRILCAIQTVTPRSGIGPATTGDDSPF